MVVYFYVHLQPGIVVVRKKLQPNELPQLYASDVMSKLEKIHIVSIMWLHGCVYSIMSTYPILWSLVCACRYTCTHSLDITLSKFSLWFGRYLSSMVYSGKFLNGFNFEVMYHQMFKNLSSRNLLTYVNLCTARLYKLISLFLVQPSFKT